MAEVVVSKEVFFIGAWRTQNVTEQLHQQISKKMFEKEGYSTILDLTQDGLYLNINNINGQTTKTDRIPLEIIADIVVNMFKNTCLLALVKDNRNQYTVFVFLCRSEQDARAMVQEFLMLKKRLSGEGYNLDMKQSGTNWTLKNKDNDDIIRQPNGGVKVITTTTTKTNGVPDSVSNSSVSSDVREELTELAKEVRDIRLQMQKSVGRHQFAKHYGYLSSPPATQTTFNRQVFSEEVYQQPEPITNEMNIVKRHYIKREPESNVVLVRGQTGQYKQRQSTSGHYLRAGSQSSLASTVRKRVYPSPNPMLDPRYMGPQHRVQTMRVIPSNQKTLLRKEYRSSKSDIVHKDIENVYKGRRMYRRIIPVGGVAPIEAVRSETTYDYVQAHQRAVIDDDVTIDPVRSVYVDDAPPKVVKRSAVHIKYEPPNDLYENTAFHQQRQDISNISTLVNVSSNNVLDESHNVEVNQTQMYHQIPRSEKVIVVRGDGSQVDSEYEREVTSGYTDQNHSGNVIVVKGDDVVRGPSPTVQDNGNVIYIKSEHSVHSYDEPQQVIGGAVYHVKAKGLENVNGEYFQEGDDKDVVVIKSDDYDTTQIPSTSNVTVIKSDADEGLWGAYAKEPDTYDPDQVIEKVEAYRYKDDDVEQQEGEVEINQVTTVTETPQVEVQEKRVWYSEDLEQTIDDEANAKADDIEKHFDDVIGNEDDYKGNDDENNNAGDDNKLDIDIDATKGSVLNELREKITTESESSVLF